MRQIIRKIDWDVILGSVFDETVVQNFATGQDSGRELYAFFANGAGGGEVRHLLRQHGVDNARRLARKALRRRNVSV